MRSLEENRTLTEWCESLIADKKFAQAEQFARVLHEDKEVKSLILLANTLYAKGDAPTALKYLEAHLNTPEDVTDAERCDLLIAKANILALTQQERPALAALQQAQEIAQFANLTLNHNLNLKISSLHLKLSEFEAAQSIFNTGFKIEYAKDSFTNSKIAHCINPSEKALKRLKPIKSEALKTVINHGLTPDIKSIYFVAGDLNYCRFFAKHLASQLGSLALGTVHLHIHGIITGEDDPGHSDAAWRLIENSLEGVSMPLTLTRRNLNRDGLTDNQRRSIYAIERFRMLPEIITLYERPVIVADMDQLPLFNPSDMLGEGFDVGLMWNEALVLDVTSCASSALSIFMDTPEALEFANTLSTYFDYAISEPRRLHWKLDQAGLVIAKYRDRSARFKTLSFDLVEPAEEQHHPAKAYNGKALFISKATDQDPRLFANFLSSHASDFTPSMLARYMGTRGHAQQAINMCERHINNMPKLSRPQTFEARQLLGLLYAHAGDLEAAHENFEIALEALPQRKAYKKAQSVTLYQFASVKAALRRTEEAQLIFDKKIETDCGNGWVTDTGIIDFAPPLAHSTPIDITTPFEKIDKASISCVYFVAADLRYCQQFFPALIDQFETLKSEGVHLHIHGIIRGDCDPEPQDRSAQDKDTKTKGWDFIRGLLEASNLPATLTLGGLAQKGLTAQQRKAAFSAERFRLLPDLLARYDRPVIVADIDQLPLQSPAKILKEDCDAQFLYFPNSVLNFLSVVSATLSVFYPTPEGANMTKALRGYIDRAYAAPDKLNWHVDQAALAVIHTLFEDAKIVHLDTDIVERNPSLVPPDEALENGAFFWSVTNSIEGNVRALTRLQAQQFSSLN